MSQRRKSGNRQGDLVPRSKRAAISVPDNHPMVVLTDTVDWTELEVRAEKIREKKLKNAAGRPPHLRATLGALTLMALRRLPYREVEEQIRFYAPARYLCGLTETDWTPDFTTIADFAQLLGEDGVKLINEAVVTQAVALGLADTKVAVADLTAQEAAIPHPNEMGLMGGFVRSLEAAAGKLGNAFKGFLAGARGKLRAAKEQVRKYRLFAKDKTKKDKDRLVAQMTRSSRRSTTSWARRSRPPPSKGASCAVMPWSRGASSPSCTRRSANSCRRSVTGCAPVSLHRARSSICTFRSCTPSCAARRARRSSSGCRGGSHGYAAASCLRRWPAPRPILQTLRLPSVRSRISSSYSERHHAPTLTIALGTAPRT